MKSIFSLLFCAITFYLIGAQHIDLSAPSKLPNRTGKFKIVGQNNDGIVLRLYGSEDVVDVFDKDLKLVTSKNIDFKNQDGLLQYIMLNKSGAVIFYLQHDRKFSMLYAQPVNSKFMEIGKPILIDSILDRKDLVASNLRFKPSIDQSYLMIYYPFFSSGKVDVVKFICVDRGLKSLYNKIIPLGREESELENSKTLIDNNGNTFLILKPEQKNANETIYDVLHISSDGEFGTYSITLSKKLFNEPWFEIDNKKANLALTAFYDDSKRQDEEVANGFVYASFDPAKGTPLKINYTAFSREFISELTGRQNPSNLSLYTFNIRKAVLRNDGGALIIAESFIKDTRETPVGVGLQPGFNNYRTSEIFQFNDIIAFSVDASGLMEWSNIMRKKQSSEDDNGAYSSFLLLNEKDKLHFMYLDDTSLSGSLNEYVLNSTGSSTRNLLLNQEEKDVMLLPKMGKQISPVDVAIPSFKNNTLRLVKISF